MLRSVVKAVLPERWQKNLVYLRDLAERLDVIEKTADRAVQGLSEIALSGASKTNGGSAPLHHAEFRIRSQAGEDGILQYIFGCIGVESRTFVEFGIQSGRECNSALLALSLGWSGLFIEGNKRYVTSAREYYESMLGEKTSRVKVVQSFITKEKINALLEGMPQSIDLLSIDIDGNDYWIWEAITAVQPRVVVVEYNGAFGAEEAVTIPYKSDFQRGALGEGMYYGASLSALAKLGGKKGYALLGCTSNGINAFFVRRDLVAPPLREVPVHEAFVEHCGLRQTKTLAQQFDKVRNLPLVRI